MAPPLFLLNPPPLLPRVSHSRRFALRPPHCSRHALNVCMVSTADPLGLPTALRSYVDKLSLVPDPKLRYQQLLFFARKLPSMSPTLKTEQNRVHGCTSIVHVDVSLDKQGLVKLQGDSDAQLTKGLLALLVNGLDGATPEEVAQVDPAFIQQSGLGVSLTPSRNNGFVNMLAKIKDSVARLSAGHGGDLEEEVQSDHGSVYDAIMSKLAVLKPQVLEVMDDSARHAGHREGGGTETHFAVKVVANTFEPLSPVQRHRMIYALLSDELEGGVHALQIDAKTPDEAGMQ